MRDRPQLQQQETLHLWLKYTCKKLDGMAQQHGICAQSLRYRVSWKRWGGQRQFAHAVQVRGRRRRHHHSQLGTTCLQRVQKMHCRLVLFVKVFATALCFFGTVYRL